MVYNQEDLKTRIQGDLSNWNFKLKLLKRKTNRKVEDIRCLTVRGRTEKIKH